MVKIIKRKNASKWEQSGERALIEIWGDNMKKLRGVRKNNHILREMALELEASGFYYTAEELKTKMHNMTNRYRKEKMKIESNDGSPSEWDLYKDMAKLLAPFKSHHSEGLVTDSIKNNDYHFMEISSLSSPATNSPKLRTSEKKNDNIDRLIKSVEYTVDIINHTAQKLVEIEEEKKEILKKFAEKEAEVQDALLEFLNRN